MAYCNFDACVDFTILLFRFSALSLNVSGLNVASFKRVYRNRCKLPYISFFVRVNCTLNICVFATLCRRCWPRKPRMPLSRSRQCVGPLPVTPLHEMPSGPPSRSYAVGVRRHGCGYSSMQRQSVLCCFVGVTSALVWPATNTRNWANAREHCSIERSHHAMVRRPSRG